MPVRLGKRCAQTSNSLLDEVDWDACVEGLWERWPRIFETPQNLQNRAVERIHPSQHAGQDWRETEATEATEAEDLDEDMDVPDGEFDEENEDGGPGLRCFSLEPLEMHLQGHAFATYPILASKVVRDDLSMAVKHGQTSGVKLITESNTY